uniref:Uncharacterized protein n=1 Tax=Pristionchus pacificus TaxID=54126 RepID=A0A2A6CX34_PRIPA|eukprot:PDM82593.1 hypothetical protein PRIPAC_36986 [Pristionchus pacificus]
MKESRQRKKGCEIVCGMERARSLSEKERRRESVRNETECRQLESGQQMETNVKNADCLNPELAPNSKVELKVNGPLCQSSIH